MTAFLRPHSIPGIGTEPGEGTPMFFRLFPSVMIDRKRLCLSGGSSVRNLRAAGPLFYSRIVRLFSSSRSGEFVRFSDFCRVAGKGDRPACRCVNFSSRMRRRGPECSGHVVSQAFAWEKRCSVFSPFGVPAADFAWEDFQTRRRPAGRFFPRPRGVSESRFPSVRWRGKSRVSSPVSFREKTAHFCWTDGGFIIPGVHFFRLSC